MCVAAGIEPVMTTTGVCDDCTPEAMGDLVEYCHGNESTTWGKQRIADGQPEIYNVKVSDPQAFHGTLVLSM